MNRYPLWKNLMILAVVLVGLLFALPNLYSQDPSVEISATRDAVVDQSTIASIKAALENAGIPLKRIEERSGGKLLARFTDAEEQLNARDVMAAATAPCREAAAECATCSMATCCR